MKSLLEIEAEIRFDVVEADMDMLEALARSRSSKLEAGSTLKCRGR